MSDATAIVTGGARGIGATISKTFYDAGYRVALVGRKETEFSESLGNRSHFFKTDIQKPQALKDLMAKVIQWSGRIDILINNAGISAWRSLEEVDEGFWQEMVDTNLKSVLFASQAAASHLAQGGSIINISSLAGKRGSANNSVYCACKFGVNGITQSLAKELGAKGIRVNAVCPVYIQTEGLKEALRDKRSPVRGGDVEHYLADFASTQSALGVLPTAKQVAQTCLFLSSAAAGAITGQCINVDCGVLPQ